MAASSGPGRHVRRGTPRLRPLRLVLLSLPLLLGGCSRGPLRAWLPGRTGEGHIYLAPLLGEHPLYRECLSLEQEIAALRRPASLPVTPPVPLELGELLLPAPEAPLFPLAQFEAHREAWQLALLPDRPAVPSALEPDLAAEVAWARLQADERAATLRQRAEEERNTYLAQVRLEARRARREAFNNAGLDLQLSEKEAEAAAAAEEARLKAEIEREVAAAAEASAQRLAEARARIENDRLARIAAAEADVWQRMRSRAETFGKSGGETRTRLSKTMASPGAVPAGESLAWRPAFDASAEPAVRAQAQVLLRREQQVRAAQAARLASRRAELLRQIESGLELAARRLAGQDATELYVPPGQPARGPDLTERLRPRLRAMFVSQPPN